MIFLVFLLSLQFVQSKKVVEYENAKNLKPEYFEDFVKLQKYSVVKFYAPWCPHCTQFAGVYDDVSLHFKNKPESGVSLSVVNCQVFKDFCVDHEVPGFPTVRLYEDGKFVGEYEGERKLEYFKFWLQRKTGEATTTISSQDELDDIMKRYPEHTLIVGVFPVLFGMVYEVYQGVSQGLDDFLFVQLKGEDRDNIPLIGEKMSKVHGILMKRHYDGSWIELDFAEEPGRLEENLRLFAYPLVGELNETTYFRFEESKLPIAVLFIDFRNEEELESHVSFLERVAENYKGKIVFGYTDASLYLGQFELMGGKKEELPGLAIMDTYSGENYRYFPEEGEEVSLVEDEDGVTDWCSNYLKEELKPFVRSQAVPENNVGDVFVVVGQKYEEVVISSERDVFIMIYAPWCPHSKVLLPEFESLAKFFRPLRENLLVAKMDGSQNDPNQVLVDSFPTLLFYPAGRKEKPVVYKGTRTENDLKLFVANHASASLRDVKVFVKDLLEEGKERGTAEKAEGEGVGGEL